MGSRGRQRKAVEKNKEWMEGRTGGKEEKKERKKEEEEEEEEEEYLEGKGRSMGGNRRTLDQTSEDINLLNFFFGFRHHHLPQPPSRPLTLQRRG